MEPGGREPAPGGLKLVQAFVNTNDIEGGHDALGNPEQLGAWLSNHGLSRDEASPQHTDLQLALEVREALRTLALANNGEPVDPRAIETLNRLSVDSCMLVRFDPDGRPRLDPAHPGVAGALGQILASVYTAVADGTWPRLKACRNDVCRWVFYDHSKNRSGTWCTMSICGDKSKARAYRKRLRASS